MAEAEPAELLISIKLKDNTIIDFRRTENKEVHICHAGHCVILPHCTGQITVDLFALLEPLGEVEEQTDGIT